MPNIRKAKIEERIVDVISFDEYYSDNVMKEANCTGVLMNNIIYPVRNKSDSRPGIYSDGIFATFIQPSPQELHIYSDSHIIDFSDSKSIKEVMDKQDQLKSVERAILTSPNNVTQLQVRETDEPEMVAIKQAINEKKMDMDKYRTRFGDTYNNDIRNLENSSITHKKLKKLCSILDIKATLVLEDKDGTVPNPMNTKIVIDITADDTDED